MAIDTQVPGAAFNAFRLTEDQALFRRTVREFAEREIAPAASHFDETEQFPAENARKMAALGLMGLTTPEAYGGSGAGAMEYARAISSIARAYSIAPAPDPPYASGVVSPINPSAAILRAFSAGNCSVSSKWDAAGAISRSANSRTVRRKSAWSSVSRNALNAAPGTCVSIAIRAPQSSSPPLRRRHGTALPGPASSRAG